MDSRGLLSRVEHGGFGDQVVIKAIGSDSAQGMPRIKWMSNRVIINLHLLLLNAPPPAFLCGFGLV